MARERKRYSEELKERAVRLSYESERSVRTAAASLGISTNMLQKWRQQMPELRAQLRNAQRHELRATASEPEDRELTRENRELRREVELLKQERDI